jgi:hypothetical protein
MAIREPTEVANQERLGCVWRPFPVDNVIVWKHMEAKVFMTLDNQRHHGLEVFQPWRTCLNLPLSGRAFESTVGLC